MPLPFFAAQKQGKLRAFPQSPPRALLYVSPFREPHSPLPGRRRFRITLLGMGAVP